MQHLLAVGVGGFFGAIARYTISAFMQRRFPAFPAGTLLVNAIGCLLIGALMALVIERKFPLENETARLFLITGILGSLTTFSTFGYETVELLHQREVRIAFFNLSANVVIGFAAVWLGRFIVKTVV